MAETLPTHLTWLLRACPIISPPEEWVRRCYNLTRFTEFKRGGHFAALERPDELVAGIREFFRPLSA